VRLIDDLLDVSRITAGKLELQRERVTLGSILDNALEANAAAIRAGGLALDIDNDAPDLVLEVDPTRLSQVISNLLQNAAKFTPPGGRIGVRARVHPGADAPVLQVDVSDTGIGIDPHLLPRVFDLFVQARASEGPRAGLGIGLALARRLVEMHGGTIEAHSRGVDLGSTFSLRLPAPACVAPAAAPERRPRRPLAGLKVLIVDDNEDAADVLALLIADLGADTEVHYRGSTALEWLARERCDVVLLDVGMPGLDGLEICRASAGTWAARCACSRSPDGGRTRIDGGRWRPASMSTSPSPSTRSDSNRPSSARAAPVELPRPPKERRLSAA
jgi:CheY-like chemotaxis protein